jgi:organic radical activating enzyme
MTSLEKKLIDTKNKLDDVAPHFCLAKWLQVTLHLQLGQNHSCHHPQTHEISRNCMKNPKLLHNTQYKKAIWTAMLAGQKIDECSYCNSMEDEGVIFSDRTLKSSESWARPFIDSILKDPYKDINPTYVEVNFSHVCNCQCAYCSPWISSKWEKDVIENGPFLLSRQFGALEETKTPIKGHNIYKEAFWKWWPELVETLQHFRITGGEPLLHKDTFRAMDYLLENPKPNLDFSVNTNLSVNDKLIDKFISKSDQLLKNKCVKSLSVFTSCDAYKKAAEYYRLGLNYDSWWNSIDKVLEVDDIQCNIMATYNIFSVTSFLDFLIDVYKRKVIHDRRILVDVPFLRNPQFLCANILSDDFIPYLEQCISYMESKEEVFFKTPGFMKYEIDKFKRIYTTMKKLINSRNYRIERHDFYHFINQWDRRKGLNFLEVFPEYEEFYKLCEREA